LLFVIATALAVIFHSRADELYFDIAGDGRVR
jgi:hypothetical protein